MKEGGGMTDILISSYLVLPAMASWVVVFIKNYVLILRVHPSLSSSSV